MALQVEYWEADGPNGEALIRSHRITLKSEARDLQHVRPIGCVRITLGRTDQQGSNIIRTLWIKPGYKSPF